MNPPGPSTAEPEPAGPVELVVEDARWEEAGIGAIAARAATAALEALGRDPARHEIALLACDDRRIAALNAGFRDRPRPTNVLSWPAFAGAVPQPGAEGGDAVFLGDVALAFETCAREADAAGRTLADHATHLIVHGLLHLVGHDHVAEREAAEMEAIEVKILATLDIADPYT
jgi:probable rRNA maturation factor